VQKKYSRVEISPVFQKLITHMTSGKTLTRHEKEDFLTEHPELVLAFAPKGLRRLQVGEIQLALKSKELTSDVVLDSIFKLVSGKVLLDFAHHYPQRVADKFKALIAERKLPFNENAFNLATLAAINRLSVNYEGRRLSNQIPAKEFERVYVSCLKSTRRFEQTVSYGVNRIVPRVFPGQRLTKNQTRMIKRFCAPLVERVVSLEKLGSVIKEEETAAEVTGELVEAIISGAREKFAKEFFPSGQKHFRSAPARAIVHAPLKLGTREERMRLHEAQATPARKKEDGWRKSKAREERQLEGVDPTERILAQIIQRTKTIGNWTRRMVQEGAVSRAALEDIYRGGPKAQDTFAAVGAGFAKEFGVETIDSLARALAYLGQNVGGGRQAEMCVKMFRDPKGKEMLDFLRKHGAVVVSGSIAKLK